MPKASAVSVCPGTLKWAKGLAIFQLTVGVLACAFFIWLFNNGSTSEMISGMQQGVADGLGKDVYYLSGAEGAGYIVGIFIFGLLAPILAMVAIARRSKGFSIAALIIYGATLVTGLSPVSIAIMVLMLVKPSRLYLNLSK